MLQRWLVVLAVAAACGGQPRVRGPGEYVVAIRIEGNRAFDTDDLASALALRESIRDGTAVDPIALAEDTRRIRAAYLKRGYFAVTVTARVDREQRAQIAVFTVVEGRRAITRVEVAGLPPELPLSAARERSGLADGAPCDYDVYDAAKQPLAAWIEDGGYAHVEVRATANGDADGAVAVARYEIVPGPRCTFGAIDFTPNTRPALVEAARARLRFARGDRYSVSAMERSQADIYELGRFSSVQVVPDRSGRSVINVAVELAEANRHELHAGAGAGLAPEVYEARLRGGYSVVPASQPLLTAGFDARVSLTKQRGDGSLQQRLRGLASLRRLDLGWPRLRGDAELGADYQKVEAYTWRGGQARLGLGAPLGSRALQLRLGWMLQQVWLERDEGVDAAAARELGLDGSQRLGEYQASLVADLRDNPIEPRLGAYLDLRAALGTPLAGSELAYLQLTPELRGYVSLAGVVLAARARVGAILGDVPVIERYYSGGPSGHRGFSSRRLSPTVVACSGIATSMMDPPVIGGAGLVETGVELRRLIGTLWVLPLGVNVFVDGGDVRCKPEELDLRKLYWAVGGGLWSKPVGDFKIRVDAGYLLPGTGPTSSSEAALEFHLGIGEAF